MIAGVGKPDGVSVDLLDEFIRQHRRALGLGLRMGIRLR
jgi:hypothetical protein